jgi:hypothetical protein
VWDHTPKADELLAARLRAGWSPVPTMLKDGPAILGYAACLKTGVSQVTEGEEQA